MKTVREGQIYRLAHKGYVYDQKTLDNSRLGLKREYGTIWNGVGSSARTEHSYIAVGRLVKFVELLDAFDSRCAVEIVGQEELGLFSVHSGRLNALSPLEELALAVEEEGLA